MNEWREGDIVLVEASGFLRRFVHYRHAALLWKRGDDWYTVEATPRKGVAGDQVGNWQQPYVVVRPTGVTKTQGEAAATEALRYQGEGYDFADWWPLFLRYLWRLFGILVAYDVICTDLVDLAWLAVGVDIAPHIAIVAPDDIARGPVEVIGEYEGDPEGGDT